MQKLNNCIIEKTELTSLNVGGDWNCTLSKKDKIGVAPRNGQQSTVREMFDFADI